MFIYFKNNIKKNKNKTFKRPILNEGPSLSKNIWLVLIINSLHTVKL